MMIDQFNKFLLEISRINNFTDLEQSEFISNIFNGINLYILAEGVEFVHTKTENITEFMTELVKTKEGKEIIEKRLSMVINELFEVNSDKISLTKKLELLKILE